jgi:GDPmannose 4,6-dehydratase
MIQSQSSRRALITGISGQDGSYLSELLSQEGCAIAGVVHGKSFEKNTNLYSLDLCDDPGGLYEIIKDFAPTEIYHLAAHHHSSAQETTYNRDYFTKMMKVNFDTTKVIVDAILENSPATRLFYAGSSQMFTVQSGQGAISERTPFLPATPYGLTKVLSTELIRYFRQTHKLWASVGILFNHESPRRPNSFVSKMVAEGVARIKVGQIKRIAIRNIGAVADWGHAQDFVKGMSLALRAEKPDDYVFATGKLSSVQTILEFAFQRVGLNWRDHVDFTHNQPTSVYQADPSFAKTHLGWQPTFDLRGVIEEMVDTEVNRLDSN